MLFKTFRANNSVMCTSAKFKNMYDVAVPGEQCARQPRETMLAALDCEYTGSLDIVKAIEKGAFCRVQKLVFAGRDVNQPDRERFTLLHVAAINNEIQIAEYLIAKGAIVDAVGGKLQSTPLHCAVRMGCLAVINVLLRAGADTALRDAEGCAAIHLAARYGHTELMVFLLVRGVSPDVQDADGMTPLMWACWKVSSSNHTDMLIHLGASTKAVDHCFGNTALHWAIISKNESAIATLLLLEDDCLGVPNLCGITPLTMLLANLDSIWIDSVTSDKINKHILAASGRNTSRKQTYNKKFLWWCVAVMPCVALYLTKLVLDIDALYLTKMFLLVCIYALLNFISNFLFDDKLIKVFPLGVSMATKRRESQGRIFAERHVARRREV